MNNKDLIFIQKNIHLCFDISSPYREDTSKEKIEKLLLDFPNLKEAIILISEKNKEIDESFKILTQLIEAENNQNLEDNLNDEDINNYLSAIHSKLSEINTIIIERADLRTKYFGDENISRIKL